MDLHFRSIANTPDEISMGHKLWFHPASGCDAVSATANTHGFTPVRAAATHFGWDLALVEAAAEACNRRGEIAVVNSAAPMLFLVPATKGRGNTNYLIRDLLRAVSAADADGLHLTHFGFLQGRFPEDEIADVLTEILAPRLPLCLRRVVFDIDSRAESKLHGLIRPRR